MIKVYYIEDLCIEDVDAMIEKGEVFDVSSKATLLQNNGDSERDSFWRPRVGLSKSIRQTDTE